MRYGPGSARIPRLWDLNNVITASGTSSTTMYWTLYMFSGVPPTVAQMNQYLQTGLDNYINFYDLWTVMAAQGSTLLAGQPFVGAIKGEKYQHSSIRHKLTTADVPASYFNSGQYSCQIVAAGTPTWFALLGNVSPVLDPKVMNKNVNYKTLTHCTIGTVGDENSAADIQLQGGLILNDLSKLPIFGDLMVTFQ